jgi:hypothetical protein
LNLKQKQASVMQVFSARQQTKETGKEGQTLMVSTIITIMFVSGAHPISSGVILNTFTATALIHRSYLQHECARN